MWLVASILNRTTLNTPQASVSNSAHCKRYSVPSSIHPYSRQVINAPLGRVIPCARYRSGRNIKLEKFLISRSCLHSTEGMRDSKWKCVNAVT